MTTAHIHPIDEERAFAPHELFFSMTDPKGRILFGNQVFTRISGYSEAELLGAPHNIIRHPGMPRAVFKLLWDYLESGRSIAAYVKNMAYDGRYYWVLAMVTPCQGGYLSVRVKPSTELFTAAKEIYRQALEVERLTEQDTGSRQRAMTAALTAIVERLAEHGFTSYDQFMSEALSQELARRSEVVRRCGADEPAGVWSAAPAVVSGDVAQLRVMHRDCTRVGELLGQLFASLDLFKELNRQLADESGRLYHVAGALQIEALNGKIAAGKVEHGNAVLGDISRELSATSRESEALISRFVAQMQPIAGNLGSVVFDVATARLEAEVCALFAVELEQGGDAAHAARVRESLVALFAEMTARSRTVADHLSSLTTALQELKSVAGQVTGKLVRMKAVQFAGMKEALSRQDLAGFQNIFRVIDQRLSQGRKGCQELAELIEGCRRRSSDFVGSLPELRFVLEALERESKLFDQAGALAV